MRWILAAVQMFTIGFLLGLHIGREQGTKQTSAACEKCAPAK